MTEFEIFKNFAVKNLTEEEVLNILDDDILTEAGEDERTVEQKRSDKVYPMEPLYRKDAEKIIELRDTIEKKLAEKTFTDKDAIDLAEKILFVRTAIKFPKDERQKIYRQYKEVLKEKEEAKKSRMVKRLAFDLMKLVDTYRANFDTEVKQRKLITDSEGNKRVIPTKGKNDQIPIKRDILQNSIAPLIKQLENKTSDIEKMLTDLDYANKKFEESERNRTLPNGSYLYPNKRIKNENGEYVEKMTPKFNDIEDVGYYLADIYSKKYLEEYFENNTKKFEDMLRDAWEIVKKAKARNDDPAKYLNADQWVALLLKKLRDYRLKAIKLTAKQVGDIILAIENSNIEGLKTAGRFILYGLDRLSSHGRAAPISK